MHLNDCWSYTVMHRSMYAEHPLMWNNHVNDLYFFPQFIWKKYSLTREWYIKKYIIWPWSFQWEILVKFEENYLFYL
jgi:hypothetical protein